MYRNPSSNAPGNLVQHSSVEDSSLDPSRRDFLTGLGGMAVLSALSGSRTFAQSESVLNIARVAVPTSLTMASENKISALNDGFVPANSLDRSHPHYAVSADRSTGRLDSWVQYDWTDPVSWPTAGLRTSVPARRSGMTGIRKWSRR
jgi:hypothetical protein